MNRGVGRGRPAKRPWQSGHLLFGPQYLADMNLYEATKTVQADPRLGQACESVESAIRARHSGKRRSTSTSAGQRDYRQLVNSVLDEEGITTARHREAIAAVCEMCWTLSRDRSDHAWWEKITRSNFVDRFVNG